MMLHIWKIHEILQHKRWLKCMQIRKSFRSSRGSRDEMQNVTDTMYYKSKLKLTKVGGEIVST